MLVAFRDQEPSRNASVGSSLCCYWSGLGPTECCDTSAALWDPHAEHDIRYGRRQAPCDLLTSQVPRGISRERLSLRVLLRYYIT